MHFHNVCEKDTANQTLPLKKNLLGLKHKDINVHFAFILQVR